MRQKRGGVSLELARDTVVERRLERARLLLVLFEDPGMTAVVLDHSHGEFVRVPGAPVGPGIQPIALAPDGRSVAFIGSADGLCLVTLELTHRGGPR